MAFQSAVYGATALGITMSGCFMGTGLALSYLTVPALLLPTASASNDIRSKILDNANRSWQLVYNRGAQAGPVMGAIGAAGYVWAAYALPARAVTQKQLLLAAAIANIFVAPFTAIVMKRTNTEIIRRAEAATAHKREQDGRKNAATGSIENMETPEILQRWANLNMTRSLFPILAVSLAGVALTL